MTAVIRLTARHSSPIPVEVDGLTPGRVAGLSAADVARIPVWHGNRQDPLGDHFEVVAAGIPDARADLHFVGDTSRVKGIGAGMDGGSVYVENDVGMHAGAGMTGGTIVIDGSAGDWLGAEMTGGSIEVRGKAGDCVGAAYRGGRRGMAGGVILVRGDVGAEAGLRMRRGLIVVGGTAGEFAAADLIAGTVVAGAVGRRAGAGMKRGTLLVAAEPELPPGFGFSCEYRPAFVGLLVAHLRRLGVDADRFAGPVRCFRGDRANGGKGEVLVAAGATARSAAPGTGRRG